MVRAAAPGGCSGSRSKSRASESSSLFAGGRGPGRGARPANLFCSGEDAAAWLSKQKFSGVRATGKNLARFLAEAKQQRSQESLDEHRTALKAARASKAPVSKTERKRAGSQSKKKKSRKKQPTQQGSFCPQPARAVLQSSDMVAGSAGGGNRCRANLPRMMWPSRAGDGHQLQRLPCRSRGGRSSRSRSASWRCSRGMCHECEGWQGYRWGSFAFSPIMHNQDGRVTGYGEGVRHACECG